MRLELAIFGRYCTRCRDTILEAGAPQVLVDVYQTAVGQPLEAFTQAMQAVKHAEQRLKDAQRNKASQLAEMDKLFRVTRSAVIVVVPTSILPATLKSQRTDTDVREAIQELLRIVQAHAGATWADNLLQGEFGQKAPEVIEQLNESIAAANALQSAKTDRSAAFVPAWSAFVRFKRLVGDTLGYSSRPYQRLRHRTSSAGASDHADVTEVDEVMDDVVDDGVIGAPESVVVPSVH